MTLREIEAETSKIYKEMDAISYGENNHVIVGGKERMEQLEARLMELDEMREDPDEDFFNLDIVIHAHAVGVKAKTIEDAHAIVYDSLKNHELIILDTVEVEEA